MFASLALLVAFQSAEDIKLEAQTYKDVAGKEFAIPDAKSKATVLLFVAVDCPISNRYAPEMGRIYRDFNEKGVSFVRVYVDSSVETKEITQHGIDFKMPSFALLDSKHQLVKALGMTVTPEVAVIGSNGALVYRGRINDLYMEHGRLREGDFRQDLRESLTEYLAGKPVSKPRTTAIGCGIPDEN